MNSAYFGQFGGCFVPELLMPPLRELELACKTILPSAVFKQELNNLLTHYAGRKTPLTLCNRLSDTLGFTLWLKREDLMHTGSHKVNNALGQALLAKHMGKTHLMAETGAGQHGVATATAAAKLGMKCTVFMGAQDIERQAPNVDRMRLLGATVVSVTSGTQTLKDAINEALRYWISNQENTHYCFGTAAGPHPFPYLVRELQAIIGQEIMEQIQEYTGGLPHTVVACVGGGSNAIGTFHPFASSPAAAQVHLVGVEAAGQGTASSYHSAPLNYGSPGVLHGQYTMLLQDGFGQILPSHSIAPGLDYPGVGPEHAHLQSIGRAKYHTITDNQALQAFHALTRYEGILPALESSHAVAWVLENAETIPPKANVVVTLSGRGDKDMNIVQNIPYKGNN